MTTTHEPAIRRIGPKCNRCGRITEYYSPENGECMVCADWRAERFKEALAWNAFRYRELRKGVWKDPDEKRVDTTQTMLTEI